MTADTISGAAAVLWAVIFAYLPKLNTKFAALDETYKRLIMLGILALTAGGAYGLACAGWLTALFGATLTCDQAGLQTVIRAFILAVIANQGTYMILPRTKSVREVKAVGKAVG